MSCGMWSLAAAYHVLWHVVRQAQHGRALRETERDEALEDQELGRVRCVQEIQGQVRRGPTLLRCRRLEKAEQCVYEDMELIVTDDGMREVEQADLALAHERRRMGELRVERPLDFWIRSVSFDKPSALREQMNSMGWPDRVLARHWEFGFSAKELMKIFVCLPPYLQQVTRRALHAVEIIMADKIEKQSRRVEDHLLMGGGETEVKPDLEVDRAFYDQQTFGLIKQHLHPSTGQRAHVFVSDKTCKLVGLHVEEMLARLANRELSLMSTEFSYFCYVMFGTWSFAVRPGQPMTLLLRLRNFSNEMGAGCAFTRVIQQQEFDSYGRVKAMKTFLVPVERGEYESAVMPWEGSSTRIQMHLNAGRDYEAWKSDFVSDLYADETIIGMQKSREGMQRLYALAEDLERMYQPFLELAEKILHERMGQETGRPWVGSDCNAMGGEREERRTEV
ncbi:hypothetical protein GUITHDRAFT_121929 [Guillardia theta CCMP2712]|uniref:Uncharacterized protein n=1 Tax=Guillardia theta (strain CCMP2712) TaxID=905079 RepID=L1I741_GUITC|nr:hypothetical protein GUITHDRAFT_121929 [Guillardia theta CCMP2712]EKX31882.1 hypothetical protein GUITHDRAFT_121929 [Guillardia theta CCMP2712]|eukprot:XP_005818862.1 hypothetical protein GUITHDRAFT_121929 [Guillardia theta CCMP2712]